MHFMLYQKYCTIVMKRTDIMCVTAVTSDGNEDADYDKDCDQPIPVTNTVIQW